MEENKNNFYDSLLDIFILIEDNNNTSTQEAIIKFQKLWKKETKEEIGKVKANEEMRKSYNSFYNR